jgi:hypothetical protein
VNYIPGNDSGRGSSLDICLKITLFHFSVLNGGMMREYKEEDIKDVEEGMS